MLRIVLTCTAAAQLKPVLHVRGRLAWVMFAVLVLLLVARPLVPGCLKALPAAGVAWPGQVA